MKRLRSLHLYLGCIFAPMLLFFAVSGIWQTLGVNHPDILNQLSTIHKSNILKDGSTFSSIYMRGFVLLMTVSFIISVILGIVMALKYGGSKRSALYCLVAGVVIPLAIILITSARIR